LRVDEVRADQLVPEDASRSAGYYLIAEHGDLRRGHLDIMRHRPDTAHHPFFRR
jgi:hypothetical protein